MARFFVFVNEIEKILKKGEVEIELPEGVRFSSAALDLIKERNVKVKYVTPEAVSTDVSLCSDEILAESVSIASDEVKNVLVLEDDNTVSEDDLEEITRRVIARFKQLQQGESEGSLKNEVAPSDDDDLIICRCEEITKGEIKEAIRNGMGTLSGVKRVTRAGMGLCQGQTCERLVSRIIAQELGIMPAEMEPITARAPVRPVRLSVLAAT